MPLTNLCDDVFQSMLEYLEYEEIARLSRVGAEVFVMCDNCVQRDVGVSVADLYHFTDDGGCVTAAKKIEIGEDPVLWVAPATNTLDY